MKKQGIFFGAVGTLAAVVVCLMFAGPATSASSSGKVFWVDLAGTARQHPDFIYFTANAGGQVHSIKWTGWGSRRAVGKGIYHDSSPNFPGKPNREGAAKIIAWKPVRCVPDFGNRKGKSIFVYRHAVLRQKNGRGGHRWVNIAAYTGFLTCR